jgi:NAD(P)-dependent dehydrogenase (short-subunit alcohol dehydrogenase family)
MEGKEKKRILLTGGTSGLGLEIAGILLKEGNSVCITGRKLPDTLSHYDDLHFFKADFSEFGEVRSAVNKITDKTGIPDIIINNAGILSPPKFTLSENGVELGFQVNLLSHLLLNELFIRQLPDNKPLLIAFITSPVYRLVKPGDKVPDQDNYSGFWSYSESKYYLLKSGGYLREKYPGKKIYFFGFNPGTFRSGIYRMQGRYFHSLYHIAAPFMRDPQKVAQRFIKVLNDHNQSSERVYRSVKNSSDFGFSLTGVNRKFFERCGEIISPYLS